MSKADWLGTAATRRIMEGIADLNSVQIVESLKEVQILNTEAAHTRKQVLSSLLITQVNMKMSWRQAILREVLPSFVSILSTS